MTEKWYYAKDGQQMDPVSKQELQRLIETGEINPTDLVWSEGMPRWVSARSFDATFVPQAISADPIRPPMPANGSIHDDVSETSKGDRPPVHKRNIRKDNPGWKIPVVPICIAVCLLAFVFGCGIFLLPQFVPAATRPKQGAFDWSLGTNKQSSYNIYLHKNHEVDLRVTSNGLSDVDLFVYDGKTLIRKDIRIDPQCFINFTPSKSGYYRVKVWNRLLFPDPKSQNGPNNGKLTFYQINRRPVAQTSPERPKKEKEQRVEKIVSPPEKAVPAKQNDVQQTKKAVQKQPAPPIQRPASKPAVQVNRGPYLLSRLNGFLPKGRRIKKTHKAYLIANRTYTINLKSDAFDTVLELNDSRGRRLASNDDINFGAGNRNSRLVFRPKTSGNYELLVRSFGYSGSGAYQITVEYTKN